MITRESFRETALGVLPHQYQGAPNARAFLIALADMLWESLGEPIAEFEHWPNPLRMTGYRLDALGSVIGLKRPLVNTGDYFAFQGQVGKTFSQAPFWTLESSVENRRPMTDQHYRPFLLWRWATLGGSPTYGELRRGPFNVSDGYYGLERGRIEVSGNTITISARESDIAAVLWDFLRSTQESLSRAMLPRLATKEYVFGDLTPSDIEFDADDVIFGGDKLVYST